MFEISEISYQTEFRINLGWGLVDLSQVFAASCMDVLVVVIKIETCWHNLDPSVGFMMKNSDEMIHKVLPIHFPDRSLQCLKRLSFKNRVSRITDQWIT